MSSFIVTDPSDELGLPAVWTMQQGAMNQISALNGQLTEAQNEVANIQQLIAAANASLTAAQALTAAVAGVSITRAGGTIPNGEQVSNVVTNVDGTVTVTTAPTE